MLEPLSEPLQKLLFSLNLCTPRDLRRCRRHVWRLARDLPAFDSVWLDALAQAGRITPFQQRILESAAPQRLQVGPCVLRDRLGGGPLGETFLARPRGGRMLCVLKLLRNSDKLSAEGLERLQELVAGTAGLMHPSLVVPHACDRLQSQSVLVSRYIPGAHLGELLVRRGRFPAAVVHEIGRQLLAGMALLESRGFFHGDIRVANVRLTSSGVAVLVDAGVRSAIDPELTVHVGPDPARYDGIAPELIHTGRPPNSASDLYALGCLMWQLLAGRPPYPGGDPLGKLASHQTRTIDDVRKWAPDTPDDLAEALRRLTARTPDKRPASIAEAHEAWGVPRRSGRRLLMRFRQRFDTAAAGGARPISRVTQWTLVMALLFAMSGAVATMANEGWRANILAIAAHATQKASERWSAVTPLMSENRSAAVPTAATAAESADGIATNPAGARKLEPLPDPDEHGVIELSRPGPYQVADISVVGKLLIRGTPANRPEILVQATPLQIWAESVRLENVHLRIDGSVPGSSADRRPTAQLLVQAQSLSMEHCTVHGVPTSQIDASGLSFVPGTPEETMGVAWKMLDARDRRGRECSFRNVTFIGRGAAVHCASLPGKLQFENCLKIGPGPLVQLAPAMSAKDRLTIQLERSTCRASGPLLRWKPKLSDRSTAGGLPLETIVVEANDCVFDIAGTPGALLELVGAGVQANWLQALQVTGEGSIGRDEQTAALGIDSETGAAAVLDTAKLQLEGISSGPFEFAGPISTTAADSGIDDYEAPRRSPYPPGIDADELGGAVESE